MSNPSVGLAVPKYTDVNEPQPSNAPCPIDVATGRLTDVKEVQPCTLSRAGRLALAKCNRKRLLSNRPAGRLTDVKEVQLANAPSPIDVAAGRLADVKEAIIKLTN